VRHTRRWPAGLVRRASYNGDDSATRQVSMSSPGHQQTESDELADNLAAYEAGLARIEARLRREHPELFDESGQLRPDEVMRLLLERTNGKTVLTGEEFSALIEPGFKRPSDAP
jgi:hypothetical protein